MLKRSLAVLALLLGGCAGDDMQDLHAFLDEVKAKKPAPIEPIPQIRQAETFLYVPNDRRDPFLPEQEAEEVAQTGVGTGPRPDPNRRKEELESYSLDTLKMVGTLEQEGVDWGLIQTVDGTIHRVKTGNYMGKNDGKITLVVTERVDLVELVKDARGGYIERQASLSLGDK